MMFVYDGLTMGPQKTVRQLLSLNGRPVSQPGHAIT
jgi:hypothetical protein